MTQIGQGGVLTLDANFVDGTGQAVNPTTPRISIIDSLGVTVISNATPTQIGPVGHFEYAYAVASNAPLGSWTAHWTGLINGVPTSGDEVFQVVLAGSIDFDTSGRSEKTPCEPWDYTLCEAIPTGAAAITGAAWQAATDILWAMSGRQFGLCTVTNLRPCRKTCASALNYPIPGWDGMWSYPQPALLDGRWYNLTCGSCAGECSCATVSEFELPYPVHAVTQIIIDGVALSSSAYRVDNQRLVVRTDGGEWPICNDLSVTTGIGAWSVSAQLGTVPPAPLSAFAVGELMMELIRACTGDSGCKLPKKYLSSLQRQGVSLDFIPPAELLKDGLLNLYYCDLFIRTFNPNSLHMRPKVLSPDAPSVRRAST